MDETFESIFIDQWMKRIELNFEHPLISNLEVLWYYVTAHQFCLIFYSMDLSLDQNLDSISANHLHSKEEVIMHQ